MLKSHFSLVFVGIFLLTSPSLMAASSELTVYGSQVQETIVDGQWKSQVHVDADISVRAPFILNNGAVNPDSHAAIMLLQVLTNGKQHKGHMLRQVLDSDGNVLEMSSPTSWGTVASYRDQLNNYANPSPGHLFLYLSENGETTLGTPFDGTPTVVAVGQDRFPSGGAIHVALFGDLDDLVIRLFESRNAGDVDVVPSEGPTDFRYRKAVDIEVSGEGRYEMNIPFSVSAGSN